MPKEPAANVAYRKALLNRARGDHGFQREVWIACSRDLLFWVNTFGMTYNPKKGGVKILPMITWPYQDEGFHALSKSINTPEDLLIEKSRDMGASWMMLFVIAHRWHFSEWESFLLGSRKEEYVDKPGDPKCLFWKIDFIIRNEPSWLRPNVKSAFLKRENLDNGSTITGESTNEDFGRGDRKTVIVLDEFAAVDNGDQIERATSDTTDCRWYNSTPQGVGNAFYRKKNTGIRKLVFHWSMHPEKRAGLYRPTASGPEILDHEFWNQHLAEDGRYMDPDDPVRPYEFSSEVPSGRFGLRGYWYDRECERRASKQAVAQELDIDDQGAGHQYFDVPYIEAAKLRYAVPALRVGRLDFDADTCDPIGFVDDPKGPLRLWFHPDERGKPPMGNAKYAIGCDVATGARSASGGGASNSVGTVGEKISGRKIAEFAATAINPINFAKQMVALAKWFNDCLLSWESNGPGRQFGDAVIDLGYRRIYYRKDEAKVNKDRIFTDIPGWASTKDTRVSLLEDYRQAVQSGMFINPSKEALDECLDYVYDAQGRVVNDHSKNDADPTGANENHGDRVIADALCWKMIRTPMRDAKKPEAEQEANAELPEGSFGWRRKQWLQKQKAKAWY